MSVVGGDFEVLKQFNLAEIYDPTPKPDAEKSNNAKAKAEAEDSHRRANTSSPEPPSELSKDDVLNDLASADQEPTLTEAE